jgi:hypothetical protein
VTPGTHASVCRCLREVCPPPPPTQTITPPYSPIHKQASNSIHLNGPRHRHTTQPLHAPPTHTSHASYSTISLLTFTHHHHTHTNPHSPKPTPHHPPIPQSPNHHHPTPFPHSLLTSETKFCVMASASSRFSTRCHQPVVTREDWEEGGTGVEVNTLD